MAEPTLVGDYKGGGTLFVLPSLHPPKKVSISVLDSGRISPLSLEDLREMVGWLVLIESKTIYQLKRMFF
jgi:hypothetical protein